MKKKKLNTILSPLALALLCLAGSGTVYADRDNDNDLKTVTPIKHVIVLIGENRSFDNIYGAYQPKNGQKVANLLSKGIINADGAPGPNAALSAQASLINIPGAYFVNQPASNKTPYGALPIPNTSYVPAVGVTYAEISKDPGASSQPFDTSVTTAQLQQASPALRLSDLPLLTTGGAGQNICNVSPTDTWPAYPPQGCYENDARILGYSNLANQIFPLTGAGNPNSLPYDSFTGDQVHRFFHMWEQSDCNVANATKENPAGCLNDLYPYVGVARNDGSTSNSMGFYNVNNGDAPLLKQLADEYTLSDNYHQPVMGGTFVQHMMMMTGDAMWWQPYTNAQNQTLTQPPASVIANPTPVSNTSIAFTADKSWTSCDASWVQTIIAYEASLPWRPDLSPTTCTPGKYYQINNTSPGILPNGSINDAAITSGSLVPPSSIRTIGDALNDKKISWAYYGGDYNAAVRVANGSTDPIDNMIGVSNYYCDICNAFQYSSSIMLDPAQRSAHIKDAVDFLAAVQKGTLPAVSYVKPDSFTDGHPASSKLDLFEALLSNIYTQLKSNPDLFKDTVLFVTWDEGGGYWDSGFYQPVDFFGDGPRIPTLAISPYSRGGNIDHTYNDHASILKFIERNWGLDPITSRSRDNLPNPQQDKHNPYVPKNMPAIGDMFTMFDFGNQVYNR